MNSINKVNSSSIEEFSLKTVTNIVGGPPGLKHNILLKFLANPVLKFFGQQFNSDIIFLGGQRLNGFQKLKFQI